MNSRQATPHRVTQSQTHLGNRAHTREHPLHKSLNSKGNTLAVKTKMEENSSLHSLGEACLGVTTGSSQQKNSGTSQLLFQFRFSSAKNNKAQSSKVQKLAQECWITHRQEAWLCLCPHRELDTKLMLRTIWSKNEWMKSLFALL